MRCGSAGRRREPGRGGSGRQPRCCLLGALWRCREDVADLCVDLLRQPAGANLTFEVSICVEGLV